MDANRNGIGLGPELASPSRVESFSNVRSTFDAVP
jgi:hypothetical protein